MLRFRPIAPKPASIESAPHAAGLQGRNDAVAENGNKRVKRKYVRVCRRGRRRRTNEGKTKETVATTTSSGDRSAVDDHHLSSLEKKVLVTLQLLPHVECNKRHRRRDIAMNDETASLGIARRVRSAVKESWIVVECVTELKELGFSSCDKDKIRSLEADTCPGLVSDGGNNVVWVNGAYREMLGNCFGNDSDNKNNSPWLVVKEKLPQFCPSFACRATLIQQTERGQNWNRIVHCDVWKMMEFVGFAWRLDLNTSIGLGL